MTNQQIADELLRNWQQLWPLTPSERIKRIDEVTEDLRYDEQLRLVSIEMEQAA
jgi:hypothetical protein